MSASARRAPRAIDLSQEDVLKSATIMKSAAACALLVAATFGAPALADDETTRVETSPLSRVTAARTKKAESGEGDRVFGGLEADQDEYPFQVALLASHMLDQSPASQLNAQFCGGSLIAPGWVLTAAHCLFDSGAPITPDVVTVLTGATALDQGTRYEVAEVIVHPGYSDMTLDNDIGLLKLATESDAPTIGMVDDNSATGAATVIGWGLMEDGNFPANLMEADIELTDNAACNAGIKDIYASDLATILREFAFRMRYSVDGVNAATQAIAETMRDPLTDNMICAGLADGARDACNGDSGGPLFVTQNGTRTQVGIVSWGEGPMDANAACGHANAYGVYTRLANYRGWIAEHMGN
jgi:secreted trypsin-like serine protease